MSTRSWERDCPIEAHVLMAMDVGTGDGAARTTAATTWIVYELTISAPARADAQPATRTLLVPGSLSLDDLHVCIQLAFQLERHPERRYLFKRGARRFLPLETDFDPHDERVADSEFTHIGDLGLHPGDALQYVYDFADFHVHRIVIDAVHPRSRPDLRPRCLAGEGVPDHGRAPSWDLQTVNRSLAETFASLAPEDR